ncbi:MAG: lactonase family protein, partial [Victivallales bacterium]|nr:lactonase family protein [Victivallales bacterium]
MKKAREEKAGRDVHSCGVFFGTYTANTPSEGIYYSEFNCATGEMSVPELACESNNPTFMAVDSSGKCLYTIAERNPGRLGAYLVVRHPGSGKVRLELINEVDSWGVGPCHVSLDRTGRTLLAANYGSGSAATFRINTDGSLREASSVVRHSGGGPNAKRQEGAHAHSINVSPDNRHAYVADLGIDKVMIYGFDADTGELDSEETSFFATEPGAGPRHLSFHPSLNVAYLANELDNTVLVLGHDRESGELELLQSSSTLPAEFADPNLVAEVKVHPGGKFLYVSNRGHDSIACYKIGRTDGLVSLSGFQCDDIDEPRHFNISPEGHFCIVGNQHTHD